MSIFDCGLSTENMFMLRVKRLTAKLQRVHSSGPYQEGNRSNFLSSPDSALGSAQKA